MNWNINWIKEIIEYGVTILLDLYHVYSFTKETITWLKNINSMKTKTLLEKTIFQLKSYHN